MVKSRPFGLLTAHQHAATRDENDLLVERRVSPEHTLLNLLVADMLRETGNQVNLTPPEITFPDGGLFRPDLVITVVMIKERLN